MFTIKKKQKDNKPHRKENNGMEDVLLKQTKE